MIRHTLLTLVLCAAMAAQAQPAGWILGGELSNSAATSVADIDEVMPRMKALGLNTVLVPAYWEFLEPTEGTFDFTLVDRTVTQARQNGLHVVFLWFGAWKNSMSCYAPQWFKQDTKRFPRARTLDGKPLEIASAFSEQVFEADNRAFGQLVSHIAQVGADVVTMVQVENEIGMLEDARDHSALANKAYDEGVPQPLLDYLEQHAATLHPWLKERLQNAAAARAQATGGSTGRKASSLRRVRRGAVAPRWTDIFGDDVFTDEIFMAYYYARYVGRLCQTARRYTQLPLYVNAAMNSRGRQPGQYPSAGPLAHLIDLWHAGAPQLLCLAPDIYDTGFKSWADQYAIPGNRLFIPESRCCENSGARAMYAFGEHQALGFSPFAIDQASPRETESVTQAYGVLAQLERLLATSGKGTRRAPEASYGLLFDQQDQERVIALPGLVITCRHYLTLPWDPRATDGSVWPESGAVLLKLGTDDYVLAGTGIVVSFATDYEKSREEQRVLGEDGFVAEGATATAAKGAARGRFSGTRKGIASVDEVEVDTDGQLRYLRRHNGDQDHQGRHVRIASGDWKILHIRLYDYS